MTMTTTTPIIPCACGTTRPHAIVRRTTDDGIAVEMWSDGSISGRLGIKLAGVPITRARTPEAIAQARRVGYLFVGEVCIHSHDDLGPLYAACRWAAARDGLPGTVRKRLAQLQRPSFTPVWTVASADRDGRPTSRYWRLPRLLSHGTVIWDHVSVGASNGRYEVMRVVPGSKGETVTPTGIHFNTLSDTSEFIASEQHS